jgi:hypothetical protein
MRKWLLFLGGVSFASVWSLLLAVVFGNLVLASHCNVSDGVFCLFVLATLLHIPILFAAVFQLMPADLDRRLRLALILFGSVGLLVAISLQMFVALCIVAFIIRPCA